MTTNIILITSGSGTFTIPSDFRSLIGVHAIGSGSGNGGTDTYGWGGGAYAVSTGVVGLARGATAYYHIPNPAEATAAQTGAWFNISSNTAPTGTTQGVYAQSGYGQGNGFAAYSIGTTVYDGGFGGYGSTTTGAGGGAAAGPNGYGGSGGTSSSTANTGASGGGTASYGTPTGNGLNGTATHGGNGGGGLTSVVGVGATSSTAATNATTSLGGGGGGGFAVNNPHGSNGAQYDRWNGTTYPGGVTNTWAGPGGGGGGGAGASGIGGNAGGFGGGAGGGQAASGIATGGLIVFEYNVVVPTTTISGGVVITPGVVFS